MATRRVISGTVTASTVMRHGGILAATHYLPDVEEVERALRGPHEGGVMDYGWEVAGRRHVGNVKTVTRTEWFDACLAAYRRGVVAGMVAGFIAGALAALAVLSRMAVRVVVLAALAAFVVACGRSAVTGPSDPPTAVSGPARTVRTMPTGLDPAYVLTLSTAAPDGTPKTWQGGPFHHCYEGVDPETVAGVVADMTALTGIPSTEAGPCNVTWAIGGDGLDSNYPAHAVLGGTATAIYSARVEFLPPTFGDPQYIVRAVMVHESGHVLGLSHSPLDTDAMGIVGHGKPFSSNERAVLAWMYR